MLNRYRELIDIMILFATAGIFATFIRFFNDSKENTWKQFFVETIISISTSILCGSIASQFIQNDIVLFGIAGFSSLVGYKILTELFEKWINKKIDKE